jgi:hypothetical protein
MQRVRLFLCVVFCVSVFLASGCAQHQAYTPTAQQTAPQVVSSNPASDYARAEECCERLREPLREKICYKSTSTLSCKPNDWPPLSLTGKNPSKVALVYSEFTQRGWDASTITTLEGTGKRNRVQAAVPSGQAINIPTSNRVLRRGLCALQKSMIKGFTEHHWPKGCCCSYDVDTRTWLQARGWLVEPKAYPCTRAWPNGRTWLDSIRGPFIEEFRLTYGWRYRYGMKKGDQLVFKDCIESLGRLEPYQLPWGGSWTLVMDQFDDLRILGKTARVWRKRT